MRRKKGFSTKLIEGVKETLSLYDDLWFASLVKNSSLEARKIEKAQNEIGVDFIGTYDNDNISYYYVIERFPRELTIDFKDRMRSECKQGVRINFITKLEGHKIEWNSPYMRSRLSILREVRDERRQKNIDVYNLHENISSLTQQEWIEESLEYLAVADKARDRSLFKCTMIVIISGKRGVAFDDTVKMVEDYARHIGLSLTRVLYDIPDFLKMYSPFSNRYLRNIAEVIPTHVLTDEIVARFNTYGQGTLGVAGIYFGTDIYSKFPVLKIVKFRPENAENWLITAETGGGKSFLVKVIVLQLIASGFNGTIMDIEGREYIPLANFLSHHNKVLIVNMGEGKGKYFDPVEIAEESGVEEIDEMAKQMSINFTLALFKVLLGKVYETDDSGWVDTVLNDAIALTYKKVGVTDDRSTWHRSRGCTLFDVYATLKTLKDYRDNEEYKSTVDRVVAIVSRYFEPDGSRSYVFKERIRMEDIAKADLVVCSFGMEGKSIEAVDKVQLALMQLGAAQMSHQRSIFSKLQGKFNFKIWEEFQRWGKFPGSENTIGTAVTGGRKLGDVNIVVTNHVGAILEDDRFGLISNLTSFLVGAIADEKVRKEFCERMSIPQMKRELDLIAAGHKVADDEMRENARSPYTNAFLCGLDKSKYATVWMDIPEEIAKSDLFKTAVDVKEGRVVV